MTMPVSSEMCRSELSGLSNGGKSLDLWVDMRSRGVLRSASSGEPARVAQQIALCDEALRKK